MGDATPGVSGINTTFRVWLRADTRDGRANADHASSYLLTLELAQPLSQDLIEKGIANGDWRGALGSSLIDGSAQAFSFGLNTALKYGFQAAGLGTRPLYGACQADPSYDQYCGTSELTLGMPSGHAQMAWTSVGLALSHRLWDHEAPTSILEITGLTLSAGTVATLRMVADKHTFVQVATGSGLGLASGVVVPAILQALGLGYDHWNDPKLSHGFVAMPYLAPTPNMDGAIIGIQGTL